MNIASALPSDALAIAGVHIRSWQSAYAEILDPGYLASLSIDTRANRWQEIITNGGSKTLVCRDNGEVLGFINHGRCRDEGAPVDRGEIYALYVSPLAWNQGIGRILLVHALTELKSLGFLTVSLWVLSENSRARQFYEGHGFAKILDSEKTFELGGRQVQEVSYLWHIA